MAENVRTSLDYVARGEVDAGFVFATDAAVMPDKVKVAIRIPSNTPATYPIAVTSGSRQQDWPRSSWPTCSRRTGRPCWRATAS
jgi:molybdate transport system substrate-binding protein